MESLYAKGALWRWTRPNAVSRAGLVLEAVPAWKHGNIGTKQALGIGSRQPVSHAGVFTEATAASYIRHTTCQVRRRRQA